MLAMNGVTTATSKFLKRPISQGRRRSQFVIGAIDPPKQREELSSATATSCAIGTKARAGRQPWSARAELAQYGM
jgi:hypothetical protein